MPQAGWLRLNLENRLSHKRWHSTLFLILFLSSHCPAATLLASDDAEDGSLLPAFEDDINQNVVNNSTDNVSDYEGSGGTIFPISEEEEGSGEEGERVRLLDGDWADYTFGTTPSVTPTPQIPNNEESATKAPEPRTTTPAPRRSGFLIIHS